MTPNLKVNEFLEFYNIINSNNDTFSQKIKINDKRISTGKIKVDKDGNTITNSITGEFEKWDDTYYISYVALNSGGFHTARVSQELFVNLEIDKIYYAKGKIDYVLFKDNFNSTPVVNFTEFIDFENYLVTQLENSLSV